MIETDLQPTRVDSESCPHPTARSVDFVKEVLAVSREAILDLGSRCVWAATYYPACGELEVATAQRISADQLDVIKTKVNEELSSHSSGAGSQNLFCRVNSKDEQFYNFDKGHPSFDHAFTAPLFLDSSMVAVLSVGTFSPSVDLKDEAFIQQLQDDFSSTLSFLWQVNLDHKERFGALVSAVIDGVILCNAEKEIQFINQAALRYLRRTHLTGLMGKPLQDLTAPFLLDYIGEAEEGGLTEINRVINLPDAPSVLLGVHTEQLKNARGGFLGWIVVLRDVTMNWENDQMRSALSIASHEFKTPLTSIDGAVELLLEQDVGQLNDKQEQCLRVIKDDISRLRRLTTDLLDLSRFDEGVTFLDRRKEISLDYLVNKVIRSFAAHAARKNIMMENKVPKSIPTFRGDRDRLQQVLSNLLENSLKYSLPDGRTEVSAELKGKFLQVNVRDLGVGIAPADTGIIFEKFKQLHNCPDHDERGYGLGLAIARGIVENSGGKIWVESEEGVGSTFSFTIAV